MIMQRQASGAGKAIIYKSNIFRNNRQRNKYISGKEDKSLKDKLIRNPNRVLKIKAWNADNLLNIVYSEMNIKTLQYFAFPSENALQPRGKQKKTTSTYFLNQPSKSMLFLVKIHQ